MSARPFLRRGPSGPLAGKQGGLVQCGYDQVEKTQALAATVVPFDTTIPRNVTPDPLQVVLPGVIPGNTLEVDISLYAANTDISPQDFAVIAAVSFKDAPAFPADFFVIVNSIAAETADPGSPFLYRSLTAVEIPTDATTATVRVAYNEDTGLFNISGSFPFTPGSSLKASELDASFVSQPGPGTLVPYGP